MTDPVAPSVERPPLTALQLRFVQEYRLDGRAAAAARRAGYAPGSARWSAYKLLQDARVRALLDAPDPVKQGTGHTEYAAIEELGRLAFANVLDFAVVRPDGALEVDLARLQRDRASAIREVTLVERTDPSGATTRVTRLKLADKSLALTRFLRVCGIESLAHEKGWEEGVQTLLGRPEEEIVKRARDRKALGWG
ncbi:MAG: terminase small subunit [Caulobacter sp.]|nr:terminase small subunit [Caulobacter sp.]